MTQKTILQRFTEKYKVDAETGCWLWVAAINPYGYGHLRVGAKIEKAHRVSWQIHNNPVPEGMFVCHTCDNPPCVNPEHLWLGTNKENLADMTEKGRRAYLKGSENSQSKLTEKDVLRIRGRHAMGGITIRALGREYGVCETLIGKVINRVSWRHI